MSVSKGFRRYRGWIALGALAVVGVTAFVVLRDGGEDESAVTYETETAAIGTISVTVAGTGSLAVDGTTDVWPRVAGTVDQLEVEEGSQVATGDVLFTLDGDAVEAEIAQSLASYRQSQQGVVNAEAQLLKAKAEYSATVARSKGATPTASATDVSVASKSVEAAEIGLTSAKAQKAGALATYEDAQDAEGDLEVLAPCSGTVYALEIEEGDGVSTGSGSTSGSSGSTTPGSTTSATSSSSSGAPVTLAPAQPLAVKLTVNEVDLPALQLGQRADLEFDAFPDLTATGKVYEIADEGTNSSGVVTFDVWVSIDVADPALRAGMSAAATIVTDVAKDALVVSNGAVNSDGDGGYYVLVMDDGATEPRQVAVETGLASATQTQILSGIAEGDVVVTQTVDSTDTSTQQFGPGAGGGGGMMMLEGRP